MEDQDIITFINPIEISDLEAYLYAKLELAGTNFHFRRGWRQYDKSGASYLDLEYWITNILPGNKVETVVNQTLVLDILKPREELLQDCHRFIYECL